MRDLVKGLGEIKNANVYLLSVVYTPSKIISDEK